MAGLNSNLYWWYYSTNFDMFNQTESNILSFKLSFVSSNDISVFARAIREEPEWKQVGFHSYETRWLSQWIFCVPEKTLQTHHRWDWQGVGKTLRFPGVGTGFYHQLSDGGWIGQRMMQTMVFIGNKALLDLPMWGFLTARSVPRGEVFRCYDWATDRADNGGSVIGGFCSPRECDVVYLLLKGETN